LLGEPPEFFDLVLCGVVAVDIGHETGFEAGNPEAEYTVLRTRPVLESAAEFWCLELMLWRPAGGC
jgi:hypothetical protein